jgi:hypothetical protein
MRTTISSWYVTRPCNLSRRPSIIRWVYSNVSIMIKLKIGLVFQNCLRINVDDDGMWMHHALDPSWGTRSSKHNTRFINSPIVLYQKGHKFFYWVRLRSIKLDGNLCLISFKWIWSHLNITSERPPNMLLCSLPGAKTSCGLVNHP